MEDRTSSNIKLFNIQSGAATAADWAQLRKSMLDAAVAADVARALYPSAEEYLGDTGILTTYKVRHPWNDDATAPPQEDLAGNASPAERINHERIHDRRASLDKGVGTIKMARSALTVLKLSLRGQLEFPFAPKACPARSPALKHRAPPKK